MSLAATTLAYACRPNSATAKLILIRLADYADEEGRAPVIYSDLADFAMCSVAEAARILTELEVNGYLTGDSEAAVRLVLAP